MVPIRTPLSLCFTVLILIGSASWLGAEGLPDSSLAEIKEVESFAPVPVQVTAVVSYNDPGWGVLFVKDETAGIFVVNLEPAPAEATLGSIVRISGFASKQQPGVLFDAKTEFVSPGPVPSALPLDFSRISTPEANSNFVTMEATVREVVSDPLWMLLEIHEGDDFCHVFIRNVAGLPFPEDLIDARIKVSGALGIASNSRETFFLYTQSGDQLTVLDAPDDPRVRENDTEQFTGTVTFSEEWEHLYVQNKTKAIRIRSSGTPLIHPGQMITATGRIVESVGGLEMIEPEIVRIIGQDVFETAAPRDQINRERDTYHRIQLEGAVSGVRSDVPGEFILRSEEFSTSISIKESLSEEEGHAMRRAKRVRVSGVLTWPQALEGRAQLLVTKFENVEVLEEKPPIGLSHFLFAAGGLLATAGIFLIWTRTLRSRVIEKTHDLTEVSARLRAAYDASRDGLMIISLEGEVEESNSKIAPLMGATLSQGESFAEWFSKLLTRVEDEPYHRKLWKEIDETDDFDDTFELKLLKPEPKSIEVHCAPVRSTQGRIEARRWTFHDVTERKKLEDSLVQAQKMEAVGRLAGGIAHDFNNLLTGIVGNLEVAKLNRHQPLKESEVFIDSAESAARRAAELIKQLLGYSRKSTLDRKPSSVNEVISNLMDLLRHSLDASIEITSNLVEDPWPVMIDSTHIEQVLMNLSVNARDALPSEGGAITISTRNTTRGEDEFVEITVEDNGKGIPESVQEKIFEPFFTTKEQGKGTGLGLAMSFGIVEQHEGFMECHSEEGQGTRFSIFLPRTKTQYKDCFSSSEAIKIPRGDGSHILLTDDEAVVRAVGEGILRHHGYKVSVASNGQEALDFLATSDSPVDLAILDLTMPQMTGKEALIRIREEYPEIPVIICSGYLVDLDTFAEEVGSRPDGFVSKPFEMVTFLSNVQACLHSRSGFRRCSEAALTA